MCHNIETFFYNLCIMEWFSSAGSPFSCSINEAARVILSVEDKVSVHKPAKFIIESEPSIGALKVQVLSPNRSQVPVQVVPLDANGKHSAQFIPQDVGELNYFVYQIWSQHGWHTENGFHCKNYPTWKIENSVIQV